MKVSLRDVKITAGEASQMGARIYLISGREGTIIVGRGTIYE